MLGLIQNNGHILEPSVGEGAFYDALRRRYNPQFIHGCEIDPHICPPTAHNGDFFDYNPNIQFTTIIGNPPYIRFQDIPPTTQTKLDMQFFDMRSNLYLFFIKRAVDMLADGGELIFITPRDFIKLTSARHLNQFLYENGTITHYIECGDNKIFTGATPNCAIWRFERGNFARQTQYRRYENNAWTTKIFTLNHGQLMFLGGEYTKKISDFFMVKVGAVSGDDEIFTHKTLGNMEFVCSSTINDGQTRTMIYNQNIPHLHQYKNRLINRQIKKFDESNWWAWGRGFYQSTAPRIYVNGRTRRPQPFFVHPCPNYDGSVLALFPHNKNCDINHLCAQLNQLPFDDLGFYCDGRYIFNQRGLQNCPLPAGFV